MLCKAHHHNEKNTSKNPSAETVIEVFLWNWKRVFSDGKPAGGHHLRLLFIFYINAEVRVALRDNDQSDSCFPRLWEGCNQTITEHVCQIKQLTPNRKLQMKYLSSFLI